MGWVGHLLSGNRPGREVAKGSKAIVTAAGPRMWPLLERYALPTFAAFAARFGYDLLPTRLADDGRDETRRQTNPSRWAKLGLLQDALTRYEIVVWLDADVMICRFDDDIVRHLAPGKFQALVLEQVPHERRVNPNSGVWLLRSGANSRRFLAALVSAGQQPGPWADQGAILTVLGWDRGTEGRYIGAGPGRGSRFLGGTGWLPPTWNQLAVIPGEEPEGVLAVPRVRFPHAIHFAGRTAVEREPMMRLLWEQLSASPGWPEGLTAAPPRAAAPATTG